MAHRKPSTASRRSLDPVVPTAVAALSARRQAQQTLREIDALLAEDSPSSGVQATGRNNENSPGPGAYSPHKERTQWRRTAAVTLQKPSRPHDKKTAVVIHENARHATTPGPGAYNVQAADRVIKPRIRASGFEPSPISGRSQVDERQSLTELEPARADKWLSRYRVPKGAVTYKPASDAVASRSREQRERLRRVRLAKTRHTRVGFYSVRYHLTERRLGSVGIVSMARAGQDGGAGRQAQARTRRKLRAWKSGREQLIQTEVSPETETVRRGPVKKVVTVQWKRAKARALLKQSQTQVEKPPKALTRHRDLVAHDMSKHTGRDTVRCHRKNRRVVSAFDSVPAQEPVTKAIIESVTTASTKSVVQFDRMIGRNEFTVDRSGVYLVGQAQAQELRINRLDTTPNDTITRKRVPAAIIPKLQAPRDNESSQQKLVLSPKYGLIDARSRGHAFVRFENQLDREKRAKDKAFKTEPKPQDTHDLPAKALETRDALRFRRKDAGVMAFGKAAGR